MLARADPAAHRHLAMQLASRPACLRRRLALPDEADAFDVSTEQSFGALTLYPLVRRQTATTRAAYESAVRRAAALTPAARMAVQRDRELRRAALTSRGGLRGVLTAAD